MNLKHLHYFWKVALTGSVVRASEDLHLSPQTVSGQIQLLEESLKTELFVRQGRKLELTEAGKFALGYAREIFSLESELEEMIRLHPHGRPRDFRVGVSDAIPKTLAYRLLAPATQAPEPIRMVCREWKLDSLLSELALHRLDLVLADAPIPQSVDVHAYSHRLGDSSLTFCASSRLADRCRGGFPQCLNALPMLLPGEDSSVRSKVLRWLERKKLRPIFVGDFDGNSLMAAFGQAGVGVFIAPSILREEMRLQYGVVAIGEATDIRAEYYAISVERRITHPRVLAITQAARDGLFRSDPAGQQAGVRAQAAAASDGEGLPGEGQ